MLAIINYEENSKSYAHMLFILKKDVFNHMLITYLGFTYRDYSFITTECENSAQITNHYYCFPSSHETGTIVTSLTYNANTISIGNPNRHFTSNANFTDITHFNKFIALFYTISLIITFRNNSTTTIVYYFEFSMSSILQKRRRAVLLKLES